MPNNKKLPGQDDLIVCARLAALSEHTMYGGEAGSLYDKLADRLEAYEAEIEALRKDLSGATGRQRVSIIDQHGKEVGVRFASMKQLTTEAAHVDKNGTAWTRPTAWAYFAACRALEQARTLIKQDGSRG